MNWTNFLLTLTLLYLSYYGLNLLYDLFRARKATRHDSAGEVLFFDEDVKPQLILPKEEQPEDLDSSTEGIEVESIPQITALPSPQVVPSSDLIQSTGAVGLKELFNLAKDNLIEFTGAISY
ncbi:hypothetical protein [Sphingobacterium hungaricum]|uniref:Uncharacterized protein n=1 Tax=Sphingobacterium hungaricum TaxID=2082723 RepID=A0A928V1A9_9SPHI|nr:hypothetical protein [Sphingobacterium hungaricum]MBE8714834.1 hypothetical protein [Sphingobacterium hungaricum]